MEGINLRYIVGTNINITRYPPVQLLHANSKKESSIKPKVNFPSKYLTKIEISKLTMQDDSQTRSFTSSNRQFNYNSNYSRRRSKMAMETELQTLRASDSDPADKLETCLTEVCRATAPFCQALCSSGCARPQPHARPTHGGIPAPQLHRPPAPGPTPC
jgi:hypothetical protein